MTTATTFFIKVGVIGVLIWAFTEALKELKKAKK